MSDREGKGKGKGKGKGERMIPIECVYFLLSQMLGLVMLFAIDLSWSLIAFD